ncbi:hypothetical protein ACFO8Q_16020 [Effusibacillus consociatus]|uniref:Uncharacterized protein n=2 Tax=Effusibacillus consociatus TaxID=1117041 RepID=A0ABV9Q4S6_9BACL
MSGSENEREVAKAFLQLDFYLKALRLPITVKDVYRRAYKKRLGDYYHEHWIDLVLEDPDFQDCIQEPFTAVTIFETLRENGHTPIIYALFRMTRRMNIGYSHAYVIGITQE